MPAWVDTAAALSMVELSCVRALAGTAQTYRSALFFAHDLRTQTDCVAKVLLTSVTEEYWRAAFHREGELLHRLTTQPGVIRAVRVNEQLPTTPPQTYHLTVAGTTDLSSRIGRLCAGRALTWFAQAARTVADLHRDSVVHRDLKPENFVLVGEDWQLIDFGAAADLTAPPVADTAGLARYTWAFNRYLAPPEIHCGLGADRRAYVAADVWALGAVLYEVISGRALLAELFRLDQLRSLAITIRSIRDENLRRCSYDELAVALERAVSWPTLTAPTCRCPRSLQVAEDLYRQTTTLVRSARPVDLRPLAATAAVAAQRCA